MTELEKQAFINSLWQAARSRVAAAGPAVQSFAAQTKRQAMSAKGAVKMMRTDPVKGLGSLARNPLVQTTAAVGVGLGATKMTDSGKTGLAAAGATGLGLRAIGRRF